jgi:non-homologous end joining protein Ku
MELIEGKLETEEINVQEPEPSRATGVPDLMAALKASVEAAKKRTDASAARRQPRTTARARRRRTG